MRIYVAGPYTAPTTEGRLANTYRAVDAGLALMKMGHAPFVPHLTHFSDERALETEGAHRGYQDWMDLDDAYLEVCDALLYLMPSRGADIELARAKELGLQIFYSLDEVPGG